MVRCAKLWWLREVKLQPFTVKFSLHCTSSRWIKYWYMTCINTTISLFQNDQNGKRSYLFFFCLFFRRCTTDSQLHNVIQTDVIVKQGMAIDQLEQQIKYNTFIIINSLHTGLLWLVTWGGSDIMKGFPRCQMHFQGSKPFLGGCRTGPLLFIANE